MKKIVVSYSRMVGIWATVLSIILLVTACSGGSDNTGDSVVPGNDGVINDPAADTVSVDGRVLDFSASLPISGALVSSGLVTTVTDGNGQYSLEGINPGERLVITFSQSGYVTTSEVVSIPDAGDFAELDVSLLPVESSTIDTQADQLVTVSGSTAAISIQAGSLVDASGAPSTGEARVELAALDPALDIDLMPGDMQATTGLGQSGPLESFGALAIQIFDSVSGNPLSLAAGNTAIINIPVSNRGGSAPPATVPLFFFDEQNGFWVESGSAALSADGQSYEGSIDQLAFWNADILFDAIMINGCIQDVNGNPVAGASISLEGFNYNGQNSARSDQQGNFSIAGQRNGVSLIVATVNGESSSTLQVGGGGETAQDVTLSECLVSNIALDGIASSLSIRLSWGLNPRDLDSHFTGPNDFHVYFASRGSLTSDPFVQLDVDDRSSYGPEVITATQFPFPGVYRYSVDRFSGSSNISASPARVRVNVGADTITYSPPLGTPTDVWYVFDVNVAANGTLSITPVNRWETTIP